MGKWTRRGFISAGVVGGSALVIGVAIRPGHQAPEAAKYVAGDGESMISAWVKIDANNHVTAIVPHSEMGQGAQTALTQMLADELDVSWDQVSFLEAPAEDLYANWSMAKARIDNNEDSLQEAFDQACKTGSAPQITVHHNTSADQLLDFFKAALDAPPTLS